MSYHDAQALRLVENLQEDLAHGAKSPSLLARARRQLSRHFADYQLLADEAGLHHERRGWLRRALHDVDDEAMPALLRVIRRELLADQPAPKDSGDTRAAG